MGCWLNPFGLGLPASTISWFLATTALVVLLNQNLDDLSYRSFTTLSIVTTANALACLISFLQIEGMPTLAMKLLDLFGTHSQGILGQRNLTATLYILGLLYLMAQMVTQPMTSVKVLCLTAIGCLFILSLAITESRVGAVQLLVLSLILVLKKSPQMRTLKWIGLVWVVLYMVWSGILYSLSNHTGISSGGLFSRFEDPNAFSRVALWSNVLELIVQQPWTGHGWRSLAYAHYSTEFSGERFMEMLDNAHNLPLHLAVELGLPVALAFCGFVAWAVWRAKPWAETRPDRLMAWGILLVIGIHSMVEYPLWYGPFFLTALLCTMILCADLWQKWLLVGTKYAQNAIILGVRGLSVALLAFMVFAVFDYHRVSQIYLQPEERSSLYADDALGAAHQSVLFKSHAKFAELVITPLSRETAPRVLELSSELIYWSPEPRVIEKLIESSVMMGLDDLAAFHLKRYRVAYPLAYANWDAQFKKSLTSVQ